MNRSGTIYGPGVLADVLNFKKTLVGPHAQAVTRRLILSERCYSCDVFVEFTATAQGDHLIPKSKGGSLGLENFGPMDPRCNALKSNHDLMDWWARMGKSLADLNNDVMVQYARQKYRWAADRGLLNQPWDRREAESLYLLLKQFAIQLPSDSHREQFYLIAEV